MTEPASSYSYSYSYTRRSPSEPLVETELSDGTRLWFPPTWTTLVEETRKGELGVDIELTFEARAGTLPMCTGVRFELPQSGQASLEVSMLQHRADETRHSAAHAEAMVDRALREASHTNAQLAEVQGSLEERLAMAETRARDWFSTAEEEDLRSDDHERMGVEIERIRQELHGVRSERDRIQHLVADAQRTASMLQAEAYEVARALAHARKLKGISEDTLGIGDGARVPSPGELKAIVAEARLKAAQLTPEVTLGFKPLPPEEEQARLRRSLRSNRKLRITEELLAEVAQLYREAVDKGEHPRGYIKDRVTGGPVSTSTVATWIGLARKQTDPATGRKFLGPAKGTRAGEQPTVGDTA